MAWYSQALGKESMSGHHCWRCKTSHIEFQKDPLKMGELWTSASLKAHLEGIENGSISKKVSTEHRGIKTTPLLDCIEPANFLFPVLHAIDLLANAPFAYLTKYVWYRLEEVPMEVIVAREELAKMAIKKEEIWQESVDAEAHVKHMVMELSVLAPEDGSFDNADHEAEYRAQEAVVKSAEQDVKAIDDKLKFARSDFTKAQATVNRLDKKKEFGKGTRDLWMKMER
jgi:hypothetical protein